MKKENVQRIYNAYIGGFINAEMAMSLIGKELEKEEIYARNVTVTVGNKEIGLGNTTIIFETLT